jgi:hypothetical protein
VCRHTQSQDVWARRCVGVVNTICRLTAVGLLPCHSNVFLPSSSNTITDALPSAKPTWLLPGTGVAGAQSQGWILKTWGWFLHFWWLWPWNGENALSAVNLISSLTLWQPLLGSDYTQNTRRCFLLPSHGRVHSYHSGASLNLKWIAF